MRLENTENLAPEFIWQDALGLITKSLGEAGGSEKIYVNIDMVPKGAYSTKYHSHSQQEEFFLVLSGTGTLKLNNKEYLVKTGDFFAKPAGKNIAHTFYNFSEEKLIILDVGTREPEDTCYYPEENMYMQNSDGLRRFFSGSELKTDWTPYPNNTD